MATIALSAAGMALGGSIGGSVLGLSMATIGRAAGAALGQRIDQQLLGAGSETVETGRIDRFRLTGATEGAHIQQVYGRMRVAGQVIWATQFRETSRTSGGGKGTAPAPSTTTYAYSVSLAVALCEGVISGIGRVWADGTEIAPQSLNMRVYTGTRDQSADPKIAAVEGVQNTPAYRGTAYVVLEDLALDQFGNRIPQLTFEVMRPGQDAQDALSEMIKGAVLLPAAGDYALATTQVYVATGNGAQTAVNTNSPLGGSDFSVSMTALQEELPKCGSVLLPVTWFGDDLRCAQCRISPMVADIAVDAPVMPWRVAGLSRGDAGPLPQLDGVPVYGGTPADAAVVEAIADLHNRGLEVVFSPQLMMTQIAGNTLPDPWSGSAGQVQLPWRGRITTSLAAHIEGSPDGTGAAEAEVAAFMGQATVSDFSVAGPSVTYTGPVARGYRGFILHYAHLCAAAGGVSAFCIGADLPGMTQVRGTGGSFPFVAALRDLATDVRQILGTACKISYTADWTEYHGYQPRGTSDKYFHLDALWADPNIDFVGVTAALPLADWRDGTAHRDMAAGSIYDLGYLTGNVAGGEGYDWSYPTPEARTAQRRVPISDPEGEPWVWRPKDFAGWWAHAHHDRIAGVRVGTPTAWVPQSKPIWFTALGCPAIDKGANQPGRAVHAASADAVLPLGSNRNRDDFMQMQYLRAVLRHYADTENNPVSAHYGGRMIDTAHMHVMGWDVRPYPFFPGNQTLWPDGAAYARGLWLNGRVTHRSLASVVAEICAGSGVASYDTSALFGVVRGYSVGDTVTGRAALQPLMLAYGFDAIERDGVLVFRSRNGRIDHHLSAADLARDPDDDRALTLTRAAEAEIAGRVQLAHIHADGDYDPVAAEVVLPDAADLSLTRNEIPLVLTRGEGQATVARWLQEAQVGRDTARFALPPSQLLVGAGDTVSLMTPTHTGTYRIDRVEEAGLRLLDATRIDTEVYCSPPTPHEAAVLKPFVGPIPVDMVFMDLPLITGDELPHAPHVAATGRPWPGSVALYGAPQDSDYTLHDILAEPAVAGVTQSPLYHGPAGIWDRQAGLEVVLDHGALSSAMTDALLSGANTMAIGDGSVDRWEVFQFQTATPLFERGFALSGMLRGQAGSRGIMPDIWPAGSRVVLMNAIPRQVILPTASRGTARHFRFGVARQPITDPSYRYVSHAFAGVGLRPYPVAHLRAVVTGSDVAVTWIRCSRIDGDLWADGDIPLGETTESYQVRITQAGHIRREVTVTTPQWTYTAAQRQADVGSAPYVIEVAQLSDRFGAGPFMTRAMPS